jgi:hypothetical protein
MVGQKVEVYWHLDKKWYEATITDENPDGTFKVKYADQSKFQANRPVIAPEIGPYAGVICACVVSLTTMCTCRRPV